jgi:hypothetical protein
MKPRRASPVTASVKLSYHRQDESWSIAVGAFWLKHKMQAKTDMALRQ